MVVLKKQIKDNDFKNIYLFYGEEEYLKNYYIDKLKTKMISKSSEMMNFELIENDHVEEERIINSAETLPFMSERRLIIVKNSKMFSTAKSSASERFIKFINNFPKSTTLVFLETKIDRRNKLFKIVKNNAYIVEFKYLGEGDLAKWIHMEFSRNNKQVDYKTIIYLIRTVGIDMQNLSREIEKLCAYKLDDSIIKISDIDEICIKAIEVKIFQLVDMMAMKKSQNALDIYTVLLTMNEPSIRILYMITRQFRLIYQTKLLHKQGYDKNMIAKRLGIRPFVAKKCLEQSNYFSLNILKMALKECLEKDIGIKTGKIDGKLAVELILIKYSSNKIA